MSTKRSGSEVTAVARAHDGGNPELNAKDVP